MRSILRSFTIGIAAALATATMAQYTIVVSGNVIPCIPGSTVNIQTELGTLPLINIDVPLNANCGYSAVLNVSTSTAWVLVSTMCNGVVVSYDDSAQFNFLVDSAYLNINLSCGGGGDCLGIINGPNMPGTACDDGDTATVNDTWSVNCVCSGVIPSDCLGIPFGPNLPGTTCDDGDTNTVNDTWTLTCNCVGDTLNFFNYDCLGILNGPNMPGTACDDNDPLTLNDTWSANCACVGQDSSGTYDCLQIWNGPNMPGTPCVTFLGDTGVWSVQCQCQTGVIDCLGELNGPNLPGTSCTIPGTILQGTWSANCVCDTANALDCLGILNGPNWPGTPCYLYDSLGVIGTWTAFCSCDTTGPVYDCNGVLNGPDQPGTTCMDNGVVGTWSANCVCVPDTGYYDCLGIFNGPNTPNTPCVTFLGDTGVWSSNCVCTTIFNNYDCTGVLNGPNMPGTPCDDGDPLTVNDTWSANCVCTGQSNTPCQANFWIVQAWNGDSLNPQPIPYELWLWNLSNGGSGTYTFQWSFGDGATSSDPYPTHTYAGNGPYDLCLTIDDGAGCTDTYCDSVSVDNNGIYTGIMGGNDHHTAGFTINVQHAVSTGIHEVAAFDALSLWPNPVEDQLNIAINSNLSRSVDLTIYDMNGKIVWNGNKAVIQGHNNIIVPVGGLDPGMYVVRFGNIANSSGMRFVKG